VRGWTAKVTKELAIADTLNLFRYDTGAKCLVAVGWCPVIAMNDIQAVRA
jgi:vacuolar-type H+-ATPase subunit I/STV1